MEIKLEYPPNIKDIYDRFGRVVYKPGVLFTYGNDLHNPSNINIPEHIMKHEELHSQRQSTHGPVWWWSNYISNDDFRYEEELAAHQVEYQVWCNMVKTRNERRLGLKVMSKRLSSDLYGNCVNLDIAKWNIKHG